MPPSRPLTSSPLSESESEEPSAAAAQELPTVAQIFHEHAAFIWRTLRHLGIPEADVPDVCQEVFLAVHRKIEGFEGRSKLRTWLYGICMRVASDHRRRAYVRREMPVSEPPPRQMDATQHEEYQHQQARALLGRILEALDEDKRAVFVLYEIEGLPMKEIAEIVGCPLQTAYSRLHAARKHVTEAAAAAGGKSG